MPLTPAILEAAERFRQRLLARERRAATVLVQYYGATWQDLQPRIQDLAREIADLREAGQAPRREDILKLERMRAIQAQAGEQLERFADQADQLIVDEKRTAIAAGEREANQLVQLGFPRDSIEIDMFRLPSQAVEQLAGFLADGAPLKSLITQYVGAAADDFAEQMAVGLASGWNPRKLARTLRAKYGMGLSNALRLARTEQLRAYREATRQTYIAHDNVLQGWERHAVKDSRTCMACILLDGKRYATADAMDDHPNGRCYMLPVTVAYADLGISAPEPDFQRETAKDWFLRQDPSTQASMLGQGKFDAWTEGLFDLDDLPQLRKNSVWGNSWTPKPLRELISD